MNRPQVYLETFGCQMNELDSELVTGALRTLGYRFTADAEAAGVVLYNTCSVREHAEQKVWSRLGELALRKAREPGLVVGVLGCMAEREGEALLKRMPVVDVLVGPGELDKLPGLLDNAVKTRAALADEESTLALANMARAAHAASEAGETRKVDLSRLKSAGQAALQGNTNRRSGTLAAAQDTLELLDLARAVSPMDGDGEVKRSAYVRITRGCNKFCTYCVVPFTRGAEVHRPPGAIVEECKRLAGAGVREITLLGQTVNHYRFEHDMAEVVEGVVQPQKGRAYVHKKGVYEDPYKGEKGEGVTSFADLLYRIHEEVEGIARLRFVTSFPRSFGDDILQVMRDCPRICRYLHVPAQSGSDRLLKLMNRGYSVAEYLEFLDRARGFLHQPEIGRPLTVAGDIIVGFPTETEEDYEATGELLRRARYKNCFIFKYSPRPGTIAIDKFEDDVPDSVKRRRNNALLALQNEISQSVGREFVGMELDVMVEGVSRREAKKASRPVQAKGAVSLTISAKAGGESKHAAEATHGLDEGLACSGEGSFVHAAEPEATGGPVQMSGRTDGDLIVFFDAPGGAEGLAGEMVRVRIDSALPLALMGTRVAAQTGSAR